MYQNIIEIDSLNRSSWKVTFSVNQAQVNTVFFKMPLEILVSFSDGTDTLLRIMNDSNHQVFEFLFSKRPENLTFDPSRNILLKEASTIFVIKKTTGPTSYKLDMNISNPLSHKIIVTYEVPTPEMVRISVVDSAGKMWNCPVNQHHEPGYYRVEFPGNGFSRGTCFIRMEAGTFMETKRMVVKW